jgi:hypothetical protein
MVELVAGVVDVVEVSTPVSPSVVGAVACASPTTLNSSHVETYHPPAASATATAANPAAQPCTVGRLEVSQPFQPSRTVVARPSATLGGKDPVPTQ